MGGGGGGCEGGGVEGNGVRGTSKWPITFWFHTHLCMYMLVCVCVCVPVLSVQCSHVTCCAVFRTALVLLSTSVLF